MKSECIELSLDLFIRLITSITELGELCSFGVWMFNVVCSHGAESGEESAKKGTELISSPQPQGLSVKAESVTIWCPWKGHFGWRGVQTFEMLLHIWSKVPTSSPNDSPRTQGHHQGSVSVTESIASQFQQVLDAFFFMGHWPPLIPLMWNKATPSLVPPEDWRGPQGKWHKIFPALAFSDRKRFSKNEL